MDYILKSLSLFLPNKFYTPIDMYLRFLNDLNYIDYAENHILERELSQKNY